MNDDAAILAMLGEAITKLRENCSPLDAANHVVFEVANDLALVHAAVSARRDRAERDGSPVPTPPAAGRGEGAAHLTLIEGGAS